MEWLHVPLADFFISPARPTYPFRVRSARFVGRNPFSASPLHDVAQATFLGAECFFFSPLPGLLATASESLRILDQCLLAIARRHVLHPQAVNKGLHTLHFDTRTYFDFEI